MTPMQDSETARNKTKIIATLGPKTSDADQLVVARSAIYEGEEGIAACLEGKTHDARQVQRADGVRVRVLTAQAVHALAGRVDEPDVAVAGIGGHALDGRVAVPAGL